MITGVGKTSVPSSFETPLTDHGISPLLRVKSREGRGEIHRAIQFMQFFLQTKNDSRQRSIKICNTKRQSFIV